MKSPLAQGLLLGLALALTPSAFGHELTIFATVERSKIVGRAYFEGGTAAAGAVVQLRSVPDNKVVSECSSDREGRFSFDVPKPDDYQIRVRTDDLHNFELKISRHEFHGAGTDAAAVDADRRSVEFSEQVRKIREDIDQLEQTLWLRDMIGGIGFLIGIFGLIAIWRRRGGSS